MWGFCDETEGTLVLLRHTAAVCGMALARHEGAYAYKRVVARLGLTLPAFLQNFMEPLFRVFLLRGV